MITIITEDDQTYPVDVDATIEVENLKALLEADTSVPTSSQQLFHNGKLLSDDKRTLSSYGVTADDLVILRDARPQQASPPGPATPAALPQNESDAAEQIRSHLLSHPHELANLRTQRPELAAAAESDPPRFLELLRSERSKMAAARAERVAAEHALASADEFDIDAQRRIEEAIRQERVMENLEHAMEYSPESFGRVTMLYVDCKVNGTHVKAFVDSGAQATIMSPECAERCGIMRLLDTRFAGIARGVGTAKILGRVHSAQIQMGEKLFLPCSFTIMEGKGVEMLFGLDMLKRYQANLDLAQNALVIQGERIRFLDEHELPQEAKAEYQVDENGNPAPKPPTAPAATAVAGPSNAAPAPQPPARESHGFSFSHPKPASAATTTTATAAATATATATTQSKWPEESIKALLDLGASRAQAIGFLDAAGGNVEVAASLLFQQ